MATSALASGRALAAPPSTPPGASNEAKGDSNHNAKDAGDQDAQRDTNQKDKDRSPDANRDKSRGDGDRDASDRNQDRDASSDRDTRDREGDRSRTDERPSRGADRDRDNRDANRDRDTRDADRNRDRSDSRDRESNRGSRDSRQSHRSARDLGLSLDRFTNRGLPVGRLASDSAFMKAGLRQGDVILSVNGNRLRSADDFDRYLYAGPRDQRVVIVVLRDNREEEIYLEPTVLYVDEQADDYRPSFGIDYDHKSTDRIVILRVHPDSPAFAAGLRTGDVITTWNGQPIASTDDFVKTIRGTQPGNYKFEYMRDSKTVGAEARFNRREARRDSRR